MISCFFFFSVYIQYVHEYHVYYHYHAVLWSFSRLSLKFPHHASVFMSHTEVLRHSAFSDGAKNNDMEGWM